MEVCLILSMPLFLVAAIRGENFSSRQNRFPTKDAVFISLSPGLVKLFGKERTVISKADVNYVIFIL